MKIIIVGCGKVGTSLAERLSVEDHDLVMVDLSEQKVEEVSNRYDAMGIVGNGASFNVQQEAGVDTADLFIAVTGEDELNLLCCLIAKKAGNCHTIARVRNPIYNKEIGFIKEKLGIKGYARYMDDGYLIHPSKEYLKECLTRMKEVCDSLGIILNTKKTKIKKLSEGFKFLQIRFKLTETGKVLRKMSFESIKKIRRKLKKFKRWNIEGRVVKIAGKFVRRVFPLSDICSAYESWRGHMKRGNSFHAVERMDLYFKKLFGFHPNNKIEWRKALCT